LENSDDALPDDAFVVRGGVMNVRDLEVGAYTHYDMTGDYALSVFCVPGSTVEETAIVAERPNAQIRVSTVGRIRGAGYEVTLSEPPPGHSDLHLPSPPSDADWDTLRAHVFDPPIPNPYLAQGGA